MRPELLALLAPHRPEPEEEAAFPSYHPAWQEELRQPGCYRPPEADAAPEALAYRLPGALDTAPEPAFPIQQGRPAAKMSIQECSAPLSLGENPLLLPFEERRAEWTRSR